jgi:hypothetical protein
MPALTYGLGALILLRNCSVPAAWLLHSIFLPTSSTLESNCVTWPCALRTKVITSGMSAAVNSVAEMGSNSILRVRCQT